MHDAAGQVTSWHPGRPRLRPLRLLVAWLVSAAALLVATWIAPGASVSGFGGAVLATAIIAALNAVLPPLVAALRLPFTVLAGFLSVLVLDAAILLLAADIAPDRIQIDNLGVALLVALIASAVSTTAGIVMGIDDDDEYTLRLARRVARRRARPEETDEPGIVFLEIDGLAYPVLRRAIRDGIVPTMAGWLADGSHELIEWETDLSSQTGASQAGILLGSNEDIPAFRWVDKATCKLVTCSDPGDCAAIENAHHVGRGLLADGGASRGNLLSGEADTALLTVSRLADERAPNPGYRSFLANGTNVTRTLVLFFFEVGIELVNAARQRRRDVVPRGHRGGRYPFLRAGMCVFVRDLVIHSVLQDMFSGAPAVYATFASYDEVAHHSGLERADTLEALRKLDKRFATVDRARRYAPRPYELVVLSDHGQTQGATFLQRNGYGLADLVDRSLSVARIGAIHGEDENASAMSHAIDDATGRTKAAPSKSVSDRDVVVLGSGNLGLVYLMDESHRMTFEEISERHPGLISALASHPHVGFVMVRSAKEGPIAIGSAGLHRLRSGEVAGEDPLASFAPGAARHLLRADGFRHAPDLFVNSFYDPVTEEGCAFEELISFHGGLGGSQTRPFILHPGHLAAPREPLVGAESINALFRAWRGPAWQMNGRHNGTVARASLKVVAEEA